MARKGPTAAIYKFSFVSEQSISGTSVVGSFHLFTSSIWLFYSFENRSQTTCWDQFRRVGYLFQNLAYVYFPYYTKFHNLSTHFKKNSSTIAGSGRYMYFIATKKTKKRTQFWAFLKKKSWTVSTVCESNQPYLCLVLLQVPKCFVPVDIIVSDQIFIHILCKSQTFCARKKDDLHSVKLVFVPAQKFLKRH